MEITELYRPFYRLHAWMIQKTGIAANDNTIACQRLYAFIYSTIGLLIGIIINLWGISGPQGVFFFYANAVHGVITLVILLLVYYRKTGIIVAFSVLILVTQLEISAEMLYVAFNNDPYAISLILGNMVLLSILFMVSLVAYIKYIPCMVGVTSICSYGLCTLITGDAHLMNFFLLFTLAYLTITLLSYRLMKQANTLYSQNRWLKEVQQEMSDLCQMNQEQLTAYIAIAKQKGLTPKEVEHLMETIGGEARENICHNVSYLLEQERIDYATLEQLLPMLTTSERAICKLILEGKKLKEISILLDKTQSNISCQRSYIRAKLGLEQGEDLRKKLLELVSDSYKTSKRRKKTE